jgi:hypothetical protein
MFAESGAYIFGRRAYETTGGWGGRHPVNGVLVFVLTHSPLADYPGGPSNLTFVTPTALLCKRHRLAPCLLGGGVRLFDASPDGIRLEKLSISDGPFATHIRYMVASTLPDGPPPN